MKPFLRQVADHYYKKGDIAGKCFVFPNRRSMVFFRQWLSSAVAQEHGKPLVAPEMYTVNDLFHKIGGLHATDKVTLLVELYECYSKLNPKAESLDDFVFWGDVILGDFNDTDKYLADPRQLYANVADYFGVFLPLAGISTLKEIKEFSQNELSKFWEEYLRLDMPQVYKVDLSKKLHTLKIDMIDGIRKNAKKGKGE